MNKKVYIAVSTDGYIAKNNGDIEWLNNPKYSIDKINGITYDEFISNIDTIIMGRNTFDKVLTFGFWPYEGIDVIVLTNRDIKIDKKLKDKVRTKSGEIKKIIQELEKENKKNLYIDGGEVIRSFLKEGQVDEIILTVIPILLGEGISLFKDIKKTIELKLIESNYSSNGFVQNRYSVINLE